MFVKKKMLNLINIFLIVQVVCKYDICLHMKEIKSFEDVETLFGCAVFYSSTNHENITSLGMARVLQTNKNSFELKILFYPQDLGIQCKTKTNNNHLKLHLATENDLNYIFANF